MRFWSSFEDGFQEHDQHARERQDDFRQDAEVFDAGGEEVIGHAPPPRTAGCIGDSLDLRFCVCSRIRAFCALIEGRKVCVNVPIQTISSSSGRMAAHSRARQIGHVMADAIPTLFRRTSAGTATACSRRRESRRARRRRPR